MRYLKALGLTAVSVMALMALFGANSASATTVEIGGVTKNESIFSKTSLASGTSALLKNTSGAIQNTCTESGGEGTSSSPYTAEVLTGALSTGFVSNCTRAVTTHEGGTLELQWTSGTNGTVFAEGGEVTTRTPLLGYITCTAGETSHMGTVTGVSEGNATIHVNAVVNCGAIPSAVVEATYTVTTPEGLGVSS
ncbi:MAG TPA: hypothetical protein VFM51_04965 [Solirubrobacterales bacterium]|nr:hypothetical protein [Solirubrobacterales bacterium]